MQQDNRQPPQSIDAEQSVLGSILIDPPAISLAAELLRPDHFFDAANKSIFTAMLSLYDEGKPIDVLTLQDQLKSLKLFRESGGKEYILSLLEKVPTSANIEHYALIVKNTAIKRVIITIGTKMANQAQDEEGETIDALLNTAEAELFALSQAHTKRDFLGLKDILVESYDRLQEIMKSGSGMRGVPTGFKKLDSKLAGLNPSNMIVVAARPGIGKTTFALNISLHAALHEHKTIGFFSLEMSKEELVDRLLVMEANLDSWKLRTGRLNEEERDRLTAAMGKLAQANIFIDDTPAISISEMRSKARKMHLEHKLDLIIVDYLQLATPGRQIESRVQEVSLVSQSMKNIARELSVPVISLSQLSRAVEQRGGDKKPQLSDLRDSGSIEQDADVVMFLSPADEDDSMMPEGKRSVRLSIAKHRNGPTGEIAMMFHAEQLQFYEIEEATDGL